MRLEQVELRHGIFINVGSSQALQGGVDINYVDRKGEGVSTKCQVLLMVRVKNVNKWNWV